MQSDRPNRQCIPFNNLFSCEANEGIFLKVGETIHSAAASQGESSINIVDLENAELAAPSCGIYLK